MSIKGIAHPIALNAKISEQDGEYTATSSVEIDRTKWGIKYNSGKFFSLAKLGDKLIYDEFTVELDLVTRGS
jgi:hypothetical protein